MIRRLLFSLVLVIVAISSYFIYLRGSYITAMRDVLDSMTVKCGIKIEDIIGEDHIVFGDRTSTWIFSVKVPLSLGSSCDTLVTLADKDDSKFLSALAQSVDTNIKNGVSYRGGTVIKSNIACYSGCSIHMVIDENARLIYLSIFST